MPGRRALAFLAVGAALVLAGCGGEETTGFSGADPANGKELFSGDGQCASCHALADAGSVATVGPDLDDAFGYSCEQGFARDTFYSVVLGQIDLPARDGEMPADLVTGQDAADVAAYVATAAGSNIEGCEGSGGGTATGQTTGGGTTGGATTETTER
jgi:mono/diheme cytochrome c family protein